MSERTFSVAELCELCDINARLGRGRFALSAEFATKLAIAEASLMSGKVGSADRIRHLRVAQAARVGRAMMARLDLTANQVDQGKAEKLAELSAELEKLLEFERAALGEIRPPSADASADMEAAKRRDQLRHVFATALIARWKNRP